MSSVWNTWTQVLKCSIKWDVLTFCFSPVSASLLHSFYSLENTTLSLAYFPPPSPLFFILVFSFLPFLRFLWVVVFSFVIMTEPYASHDASEIEPLCQQLISQTTWLKVACKSINHAPLWHHCGEDGRHRLQHTSSTRANHEKQAAELFFLLVPTIKQPSIYVHHHMQKAQILPKLV